MELRGENGYYVDKSLLIREVIHGSKVLLVPRPRRFGKTLNMSMLRYFFDREQADTAALFDDLAIAEDSEAMAHRGRYPVIYCSLKDIKGDSWDIARAMLAERIGRLYKKYNVVQSSLPQDEADRFERIMMRHGGEADLQMSVRLLISQLHDFHGSQS